MTSPDPTPKSQAQILVELEATLKTLLVVLKDTIQVKENAEVSQERIQDLIDRIEQIETNPTDIAELTRAIEQLVVYIQKIPKTDLNPLSTKLEKLDRQIAAIPTSHPSAPNLSNLVTESQMREFGRELQARDWIGIGVMASAMVMFLVTAWMITDTRSKLEKQIEQMPVAIERYQTQLKEEAAEAAKTKKQKRQKSNR